MMSMSLILCAPLRGFQAFRMPEVKRDSDDTLALPGSLYDFQEGGTAYVASRYSLGNGTTIQRLAIYRQVYEPHLKRLGHSFGVILECHDQIPDASKIVEILSDIVTSISQHCVEGGAICQEQQFFDFLQNKVSVAVPQILAQLNSSSRQSIEGIKLGLQQKCVPFEIKSSGAQILSEVASVWNWYLTSPGSLLISTLVAATSHSGRFGPDVGPAYNLSELERMASRMLLEHSRSCEDENVKVKVELTNLLNERNSLRLTVEELREKVKATEQALTETTMQFQSLVQTSARAQSSTWNNSLDTRHMMSHSGRDRYTEAHAHGGASRHSLTDADFSKIRGLVQEVLRYYEPQQPSAVNETRSKAKQESWYESWVVLTLAGGLILGAAVLIGIQTVRYFS